MDQNSITVGKPASEGPIFTLSGVIWLRRKRISRDVPMEELSAEDGQVLPLDSRDPGPSPEDSYLETEWKQILYQAMNEFSPAIRTAMELRHISELSTDETAGIMRVSVEFAS